MSSSRASALRILPEAVVQRTLDLGSTTRSKPFSRLLKATTFHNVLSRILHSQRRAID